MIDCSKLCHLDTKRKEDIRLLPRADRNPLSTAASFSSFGGIFVLEIFVQGYGSLVQIWKTSHKVKRLQIGWKLARVNKQKSGGKTKSLRTYKPVLI